MHSNTLGYLRMSVSADQADKLRCYVNLKQADALKVKVIIMTSKSHIGYLHQIRNILRLEMHALFTEDR
jgi:hypothetical protein